MCTAAATAAAAIIIHPINNTANNITNHLMHIISIMMKGVLVAQTVGYLFPFALHGVAISVRVIVIAAVAQIFTYINTTSTMRIDGSSTSSSTPPAP